MCNDPLCPKLRGALPPDYPCELHRAPTIANCKVGDTVQFDRYKWKVLEVRGSQVLLITERIVEKRPYHVRDEAITWAECTLRQYLNGEFYNAFTPESKARIAETTIQNPNNPWYGTAGGQATKDRIFLLSIEEVVRYFGDSGQLQNRPKDAWQIDDQYNNARKAVDAEGSASWWWLRSPGYDSGDAAGVYGDGLLCVLGGFVNLTPRAGGSCVRPALWVSRV
jgi:hypothetical protein